MSRREHFDGGHGKPEHNLVHEVTDPDQHLSLIHPAYSQDYPAAKVTYQEYEDDSGSPTIDVDYLKSHDEGKGYAKTLMEGLYNKYPKHHINWGLTIKPAATHLAEQFDEKHGRTSWEQNEDDEDDF
jgi:hypothetical protein